MYIDRVLFSLTIDINDCHYPNYIDTRIALKLNLRKHLPKNTRITSSYFVQNSSRLYGDARILLDSNMKAIWTQNEKKNKHSDG